MRRYFGFSGISLNQKGPQVWADFVHKTDELVVLAEGEQELLKQIHELKIRLETDSRTQDTTWNRGLDREGISRSLNLHLFGLIWERMLCLSSLSELVSLNPIFREPNP